MLPMLACGGLDGLIPVANVVFYANIVGLLGFSAYGIKTGRLSRASADEYAAAGLPKPYEVPNHASLQEFYDTMLTQGNSEILYAYYERNKSDTNDALIKTINVIFKIGHDATPGAVDAQPATVVRFKESISNICRYLNCTLEPVSEAIPTMAYGIAHGAYYEHELLVVNASACLLALSAAHNPSRAINLGTTSLNLLTDLRSPSANWLELCQAVHEAMPEISRALLSPAPGPSVALAMMAAFDGGVGGGGGGGSEPERH